MKAFLTGLLRPSRMDLELWGQHLELCWRFLGLFVTGDVLENRLGFTVLGDHYGPLALVDIP